MDISKTIMAVCVTLSALTLTNCAGEQSEAVAGEYTLYRTDTNAPNARIYWARFAGSRDASENREDCEMTARVMNANMDEFGKRANADQYGAIGFWCEAGSFSTEGENPNEFGAEFPSNRKESARIGG